jgi:hypothetical protein
MRLDDGEEDDCPTTILSTTRPTRVRHVTFSQSNLVVVAIMHSDDAQSPRWNYTTSCHSSHGWRIRQVYTTT